MPFEIGNFSLGTLLGLVLGAFLGHALAIRRGKSLVRHGAAIEFRKALIPGINRLNNGESQFTVIQDQFERQYEAAQIFSAYLPNKEFGPFKKDLEVYRKWQRIMYDKDMAEVLYETNDPEYLNAKNTSPLVLIDNLLAYAKT